MGEYGLPTLGYHLGLWYEYSHSENFILRVSYYLFYVGWIRSIYREYKFIDIDYPLSCIKTILYKDY